MELLYRYLMPPFLKAAWILRRQAGPIKEEHVEFLWDIEMDGTYYATGIYRATKCVHLVQKEVFWRCFPPWRMQCGARKVAKIVHPAIVRGLNKQYLKLYPPEPRYLPYDEYDQAEESHPESEVPTSREPSGVSRLSGVDEGTERQFHRPNFWVTPL